MNTEELSGLSYQDLAIKILNESKKTLSTIDLFHKIADILGLSEIEYENKLEDFFATLTTDKNFILLDNGEWDLKSNHVIKIVNTDDEEEFEEDYDEEGSTEEEDFSSEEEVEDNYDEIDDENEMLDDDDGLGELSVVSEEELEEN